MNFLLGGGSEIIIDLDDQETRKKIDVKIDKTQRVRIDWEERNVTGLEEQLHFGHSLKRSLLEHFGSAVKDPSSFFSGWIHGELMALGFLDYSLNFYLFLFCCSLFFCPLSSHIPFCWIAVNSGRKSILLVEPFLFGSQQHLRRKLQLLQKKALDC